MDGVWIHFSGLASGATQQDVEYLTDEQTHCVEFDQRRARETSGRFLVANTSIAHSILQKSNYTLLDGRVVRLSMNTLYLQKCSKLVIRGTTHSASEEMRLYEYCRSFGTVCAVDSVGSETSVWFNEEADAERAVAGINGGFGMGVQAYIDSSERVMVVDSEGEAKVGRKTGRKSARPSAANGDGVVPKKASAARKSARQSVANKRVAKPKEKVAARKSTGHGKLTQGPATNHTQGSATDYMQGLRQGTVVRTEPDHIQHPYVGRRKRTTMANLRAWRARAPFTYEFIYRRTPDVTAVDDGLCLSMAWSNSRGRMVNCFLSQGNTQTSELVQSWAQVRQSSDDVASAITQTTFDLPQRGHMGGIKSLLSAFNSDEVPVLHKNQKKDDYAHAITSLKLRDEGRVLFGCAMERVMVWTTDSIQQRESLLLLDGVDGVYDVGRDFVVASSMAGEVGVWKSASRNYMWRYNDTRRLQCDMDDLPVVSSLHVTPSDDGALVGYLHGTLAYCDFRVPNMKSVTSFAGAVRCIESTTDHCVVVGTDDGSLSLLDTRYVRSESSSSIVRTYEQPVQAPITTVRSCPHDPRVFAVAVGTNVHIYSCEPRDLRCLLFTHEAHQSKVMDLGWHPSPEFSYTIGSVELGSGRGSGEFQIWRPSDFIL
ncbi:GATOR complex protein wdr59 [Coemansia sp. RSA 1972]|nr:GATOR complex protein wdr59 [Coemansia sp. RSA 1972]